MTSFINSTFELQEPIATMKQPLLKVAALLAASLAPNACAQAQQAPAKIMRPNVLFIAVYDIKPLLGCYGDKTVRSPNIDRLAARGMLFERAYCNQAVCAPSRNALMTGLRPQTLGIYDLATNFRKAVPNAVTLPQSFMRAGYHAAAIGKIMHRGHGNVEDTASWSVPAVQPGPEYAAAATLADRRKRMQEARQRGVPESRIGIQVKGPATESVDGPDNAYGDGKIADEAIKRLQAAKVQNGQPFFLALGFSKPHLPFCAPTKYWNLYNPAAFSLAQPQTPPQGAPSFAPQFGGELRQYVGIPKKGDLPAELQRHLIHGYHAATSYMDAQVGRVLDALDANGLSPNTIIVLWGDHGWHLGDHGMWCKHTNYEEAARIPLIVAAPGLKRGVKSTSLVETVDLYPTLCELAGVAPQAEKLEGTSFVPILKNPVTHTKDSIIHVYPRNQALGRAIRTARHRLVEWKQPGAAAESAVFELYDYQTDPRETRNLAAEQPEVMKQLRAILARHPEAKPQISAAATISSNGTSTGKRRRGENRTAMFARRDKDGDGKLTRDEFLLNQPDPGKAPQRFTLFDTNKDGALSKDEFLTMGGTTP
ncbi:MAG: iduronate 2-sulfatase [Abditibacteriota bacterium]|nr:iduronate 2-sulfatase [Abditibacteriota bacterium]